MIPPFSELKTFSKLLLHNKDRHRPVFFIVCSPGFIVLQKLNHIHQNPVEEGLTFRAEDYNYSSAIDCAGEKEMLDIFVIG